MLEVELENVRTQKYPWGLKRKPITRVFPFVDLNGDVTLHVTFTAPFKWRQ